jgi:hypothetical protein
VHKFIFIIFNDSIEWDTNTWSEDITSGIAHRNFNFPFDGERNGRDEERGEIGENKEK